MIFLKPLTLLLLCSSSFLLACVSHSTLPTGIYFFKAHLGDTLAGDAIFADISFEMTTSLCEIVVSGKHIHDVYRCSVRKQGDSAISVHFVADLTPEKSKVFDVGRFRTGEKLFSITLNDQRYITEWAAFYPDESYAPSGSYLRYTYHK